MLNKHDYDLMSDGQRQILLEGVKIGRQQVKDFIIRKYAKMTPAEKSVVYALIEELETMKVRRIF